MIAIPHYYEDPKILHIGTLPNHAHFIPFANKQQALSTPLWEAEVSPRVMMLSRCDWLFAYYHCPGDVPENFYRMDSDTSDFHMLPVPSCWQMYGYDHHQYSSNRYPFPYDPPYVPVDNPCGTYIRRFFLSEDQCSQRIVLHFDGVDSCFYVWVNGNLQGYSQVSHATSEFDITDNVHPGENHIAILVLKWCDGSYLEDQDKLRMSGIFRDVYLIFRPENHVQDFFVQTTFPGDYSSAEVSVKFNWQGEMPAMQCTLLDPDGRKIDRKKLAKEVRFAVDNPRLWNAEHPILYTLLLEGEENIVQDVGLRQVETKKGVLYLNGQNIKFKGVNRHDSNPFTGYVISPSQMLKDLALMKQSNLNAIRTSHYPNAPWAPQMFSRFGFYTISEADMEAHGTITVYGGGHDSDYFTLTNQDRTFGQLAHDSDFYDAIVDRSVLNVERDKNAASVLVWSLGNESAYGPAFEAAAAWVKKRDPKRLVHYESSIYQMPDYKNNLQDIDLYSRMYAPVEAVDMYFRKSMLEKPFIQCEFAHAMGNGPGDLEAYFQRIYRYDGFAGGFVWEWCDHAVSLGEADGRNKFAYGGDFGEFPHDGDYCMDGLVYPDRKPHTGLAELKNVARPARVVSESFTNREITVYSTLDFTRLDDAVYAKYVMLENGVEVKSGSIHAKYLAIGPHEKGIIPLPTVPQDGKDGSVLIYWYQKKDTPLGKAGVLVGFDQVFLQKKSISLVKGPAQELAVTEDERRVIVSAPGFCYEMDKSTGLFAHVVKNNINFLVRPMEFNIWRAPVSNDKHIRKDWEAAGYDRCNPRVYSIKTHQAKDAVQIAVEASLCAVVMQPILRMQIIWTVYPDGILQFDTTVARESKMPYLPRFGLRLFLQNTFQKVQYTGYGPGESYQDKHKACWYAAFETDVGAIHEDYIRPQENGARFGCTRLTLPSTRGALLVAGDEFSFNASCYTQEELTEKNHNWELVPSGYTVLCLDYKQSGLGSNSCGPELAEEFRLQEDNFHWKVEMAFDPDGSILCRRNR